MLQIWDLDTFTCIRNLKSHSVRISSARSAALLIISLHRPISSQSLSSAKTSTQVQRTEWCSGGTKPSTLSRLGLRTTASSSPQPRVQLTARTSLRVATMESSRFVPFAPLTVDALTLRAQIWDILDDEKPASSEELPKGFQGAFCPRSFAGLALTFHVRAALPHSQQARLLQDDRRRGAPRRVPTRRAVPQTCAASAGCRDCPCECSSLIPRALLRPPCAYSFLVRRDGILLSSRLSRRTLLPRTGTRHHGSASFATVVTCLLFLSLHAPLADFVVADYDVVSAADRHKWSNDPFEMTGKDGWIYGRGVSDNKVSRRSVLGASLLMPVSCPGTYARYCCCCFGSSTRSGVGR